MKKQCLAAVSLLAAGFLCPGEVFSETPAGRVLTVRKNVEVVRDDSRQKAKPRMDLLLKDAVETDSKARTKLFFSDDSILNLGELSKVVVEEYLYSPEKKKSKSIYRLVDGTLKVIVGRSDLEIHTSTAVVAARGTTIIAWEEGAGQKRKSCALAVEGEFVIRNRDARIKGEEAVSAGTMSCVPLAGPPLPKYEAGGTMEKMNRVTSVMGGLPESVLRMPVDLPQAPPQSLAKALEMNTSQQISSQQPAPPDLPAPTPPPEKTPDPPRPPRASAPPPPSPPSETKVTITFDLESPE